MVNGGTSGIQYSPIRGSERLRCDPISPNWDMENDDQIQHAKAREYRRILPEEAVCMMHHKESSI
jgi:hypothetical protein